MWVSAAGTVTGHDHQTGCAHHVSRRWAHWWNHHIERHGGSTLGEYPGDVGISFVGTHPAVERVFVSRQDFSARVEDWLDLGSWCQLRAETLLNNGWKSHAYPLESFAHERIGGWETLRSEDEIGVHAYAPYGAPAMALLLPAWLYHGWEILDEWDDEVNGVPVIRHRAARTVPLSDDGMTGHELNPVVFHEAEDVVFAYDPDYDIVREWYDLWEGEPCSRYTFSALEFLNFSDLGMPYLIEDN